MDVSYFKRSRIRSVAGLGLISAFLLVFLVSGSFAAAPSDGPSPPQPEIAAPDTPSPAQPPAAENRAETRQAPSQAPPADQPVAAAPNVPAAPAQGASPAVEPTAAAGPAAVPEAPAPKADVTPSCPPEYLPIMQRTLASLMKEDFSYASNKVVDPFVPFIQPTIAPPQGLRSVESDEDEPPPEPPKPLTPLQKMSLTEIESGLKAITWGDYGRRALIEDSAGKGYIVAVGTPLADRNGVVTEIFNDRLVVHQETWDRRARKMMPEDSVVKLKKKEVKP